MELEKSFNISKDHVMYWQPFLNFEVYQLFWLKLG